MAFKTLNDDGEEIEAYTKEEFDAVNAKIAEAEAAAEAARTALAQKTNDIVRMKDGFKKFEELTEQEKSAMSQREIENMQRIEQMEETTKRDREAAKDAMLVAASKNDPKVLEKIKEKYALVQMPEGTIDEIRARVNSVTPWAYSELGIVERQPMPIEAAILGGGLPPRERNDSDKRYADTPEGKAKAKAIFGNALPETK